ncbi:MAG: DUF4350 domain-containing protein [Polyangiales bacterium]
MRALMCMAIGSVWVALMTTSVTARAQPRWDGLDSLLRASRDSDAAIEAPDVLDLSHIDSRDALLIIAPDGALPTGALTTFLREGGRIALLDDFGPAERLLAAYQVTRLPAPSGDVPALRDDPSLLIAYPASEHPLVEGVDLLLTNGASALHHRELKPVFTFGHTQSALVLAGAVGAGRLVAIGDASLLINQMMTLPAHQRFAKNLLTYLKRPGGRVLLVDAHTRVEGSYGGSSARGIAQVDGFLKRIAHPDLPPGMLSLLGLGLAAIAIVIVVGGLPRRSPYVRSELLPRTSVYAGFAARVALSERDPPNLVWTLLDYRRELTAELSRALSLGAPASSQTIVEKARATGLADDAVRALEAMLARLDQLAAAAETETKPPRIRVSELRNVVRLGEELLTRIGNG